MAKVMMVLGDIWVGFGHEGGALMGGVSALVEEAPKTRHPFCLVRIQDACDPGGDPHRATLAPWS